MPIINVLGATNFLGYYTDLTALQAAHPTAEAGDWAIVDGDPAAVYAWDTTPGEWVNSGTAGSITSVFGRTGPNIVAEAGDYGANQVTDTNAYTPQLALPYGTTEGFASTGTYIDSQLASLAAQTHDHVNNLANLDTINQDLRTTSAVSFASLSLTQAVTAGTQQTFITMTDSVGLEVGEIFLETDPDLLDAQNGLGLRTTENAIIFETDGGTLAAKITAGQGLFEGDVLVGDAGALSTQYGYSWSARTAANDPVSASMRLHPDNNELVVTASASPTTPVLRSAIRTAISNTAAFDPGSYLLYVDHASSAQTAAFSSDHANGTIVNVLVDASSEVINIGSLPGIWGGGTKYDGIVLGQYEMHLMGLDGVFINETSIYSDQSNKRVGIQNTSPAFDLDVNDTVRVKGTADFDDGAIQLRTDSGGTPDIVMNAYRGPAEYFVNRYNGSPATSITGVLADDIIADRLYYGYFTVGATGLGQGHRCTVEAIEDYTSTARGTRTVFRYAPVGGTVLTDALKIDATGTTTYGKAYVEDTTPKHILYETDGTADARKWVTQVAADTWTLGIADDAESTLAALLQLTSSDFTVTAAQTLNGTLQFGAGQAVSSIQTAITDTDAALPTSGAVVDYLGTNGYVTKTGTPVDNQVAVWTADGIIEGDAGLTYDSLFGVLATAGKVDVNNTTPVAGSTGSLTDGSIHTTGGIAANGDINADGDIETGADVSGGVLKVWSKDWGGLGTDGEVYAQLSASGLDWYGQSVAPPFTKEIALDDDPVIELTKESTTAGDSTTDVKGTLRISKLNNGDELLKTDTDGDVLESGIVAAPAPAGGSGFTFVEYDSDPVNPPAGFAWFQAKDANTKTFRYTDDGVTIYSVDLSV